MQTSGSIWVYCEPVDGEVMSWLSEVAMRSSTLNGQHQTLGEMGHSNISKALSAR